MKSRVMVVCALLLFCSGFSLFAKGSSEGKEEKYVIRLGHSDKPVKEAIIHVTALKFEELVKASTQDQVKVEIYPANQLGDQTVQVKNVQQGMQEMFQGSVGNLAQSVPALNYMSLPYIFTSKEDARKTIDTMWNMNSEWAIKKAGVRPLIWTDAGFRNLTNSKRPIKKLGDLKGLRIRIPPNPVFVAAFKAFGIDPVTLSWSETFNALQQGVVDGQENCYSAVQTESFYESQKYATDIQWLYTVSHFSISEKYFQSLPAAVQEKIIQAGKDATAWERKKMDEMETEIVQFLKDKRMEFYGVPDDYESWIKAGQSVWPQFYSMIGDGSEAEGKAVIDRVMASK